MQELVDKLYKMSELHVNDLSADREYKAGLRMAAIMAEGVKDLEKEAIQQAFYEGMCCQVFDPNIGRAEMYYNEVYKNLVDNKINER